MSRFTVLVSMILLVAPMARGDDDDRDKTIAELKAKVASLERRVAQLEKLLAPMQADAQQKAWRGEFEKRAARDAKTYNAEQLVEIDALYQTIRSDPHGPKAKTALERLTKDFSQSNRAGVAMLYFAQAAQGEEKPTYLQAAIDHHSDCLCDDGVQVGAYARYLLGLYYREKDQNPRAAVLFDAIRKEYPYAIDHKGRGLEEQIPKD